MRQVVLVYQTSIMQIRSSKTVDNDQVFRLSGNVIRPFLVGFHCAGHVLVFTICLVTKLVFERRINGVRVAQSTGWHDGLQMERRIPHSQNTAYCSTISRLVILGSQR